MLYQVCKHSPVWKCLQNRVAIAYTLLQDGHEEMHFVHQVAEGSILEKQQWTKII
jgi:hypothetical protein